MESIINLFSDLKRDKIELFILTIYNIIFTFFLFGIFNFLIQPTVTKLLGYNFDIFMLNSIMIPLTSLMGFVMGSISIHKANHQHKIIPNLKIISGGLGSFYKRNIFKVLVEVVAQIIISFVLLLLLISPELNYSLLLPYIFMLLLLNLFFINLGMIIGCFDRRKILHVFSLEFLFLIVFAMGGMVVPARLYPLGIQKLMEYFPGTVILKGGVNILLTNFRELLLPAVYIFLLNVVSIIFSNWFLGKEKR